MEWLPGGGLGRGKDWITGTGDELEKCKNRIKQRQGVWRTATMAALHTGQKNAWKVPRTVRGKE